MKAKGLGTGLGALFGDAAITGVSGDFEYVPIQLVEPRETQPRLVFEDDKIQELAESIREHGILSPLTVRRIGEGYYQIIAGERRWRAAREVGLAEIPVRIIEADDKTALEIALVENLQREDLSPIEEARGYKALMDEFGMTQELVASRVGKSRPAVANALRLLTLPQELIDFVGNGFLSVGSARALLAIKNIDEMLLAAKQVVEKGMNVREVENLAKRINKGKAEAKPIASSEVDYVAHAQNQLSEALGRKVTIKQGKLKGKIELEYYDLDDFNELFDSLVKRINNKAK
ncbi:MAG: ParB/RepB/Spo0J family partition protein [Oscillospiraceae bacterium]|nr:ParB/RepB/Spo0J family partition protein [Oscillospiraceae bacterium]